MAAKTLTMLDLLSSMNDAFACGRQFDAMHAGSAIDCPIDHTQLMARMSWFEGFSSGRKLVLHDRGWSDLTIWQ